MRKVNVTIIRPWVAKKIVELVGIEDEVVVEYAMGLLEDESQPACCSMIFSTYILAHIAPDTGSQENANKPYRLPDQKHTCLHVGTLEAAS